MKTARGSCVAAIMHVICPEDSTNVYSAEPMQGSECQTSEEDCKSGLVVSCEDLRRFKDHFIGPEGQLALVLRLQITLTVGLQQQLLT